MLEISEQLIDCFLNEHTLSPVSNKRKQRGNFGKLIYGDKVILR